LTKWQGTNETVIINSVGADVLDSPRQMAKNGQNGRLIASPTNTIYSITVGEDIILPQNKRQNPNETCCRGRQPLQSLFVDISFNFAFCTLHFAFIKLPDKPQFVLFIHHLSI